MLENLNKSCIGCQYENDPSCEGRLFCKLDFFEKPEKVVTADDVEFDEDIHIDVNGDELNKILEFQDLTKTETISDAVMLAIKIATFTLTYVREKGSGVK